MYAFSFIDDVKWFFNLLAAYKQQTHNILEFLSKYTLNYIQ